MHMPHAPYRPAAQVPRLTLGMTALAAALAVRADVRDGALRISRERTDEWQRLHDAIASGSFAGNEHHGAYRLPSLVNRSQCLDRLRFARVANDDHDRRRDERALVRR